MIDFSLMPLIQIVWEAGLHWGCKIGILHKFFQVTCISSMETPHQIAILLALWETALPIMPTLTLFFWPGQPLARNLLPEWVSWLLTRPVFLFASWILCLQLLFRLLGNSFLSGVSSSWTVFDRRNLFSQKRFTFSLDNSDPSMQSGIWRYSESCLVSF